MMSTAFLREWIGKKGFNEKKNKNSVSFRKTESQPQRGKCAYYESRCLRSS
jgi:hypothetical protein